MLKKNHIVWGVLWGLLLPAIIISGVYFAFYLNGLLLAWELMGQIVIFSIATNIVPAQYFSKRYVEYTARGVMVVTMLLVLLWAILFMLD